LYSRGDSVGVQEGYIWFECHDYGHFSSQCSHWKERGRRQQASASKADEVADRFQREILLVSTLSITISSKGNDLVDRESSFHMTGARELFDTFIEVGSYLCVDLGMRVKHVVRGSCTISF
jgi:hypothetical protein